MQGKQAKMVSPTQERAMLGYLDTTRSPARDRVLCLLWLKAGLRAKAMAALTWAMVTDAPGQVAEAMYVPNRARKGATSGRTLPLHSDLQAAIMAWQTGCGDLATPEPPILCSERAGGLSPATVRWWFHRLSPSLKMDGCASHAGRRTFMTCAARTVSQVGGSLRDVQELAGPPSLAMTPRSIEGDTAAKRTRVALLRSLSLCRLPLESDRQPYGSMTQRHRRPSIASGSSTWGGLMTVPPPRGGVGGPVPRCGGRGNAPHAAGP
jgi:integrase/recombinase XerC